MADFSPKVSVVIVSYNTIDKLRRCLECLHGAAYEVIVVDNASTDGSVEMVNKEFPWVKLIASEQNLGFSRGNNAGARLASGDLVLYLNSDAYASPGAVSKLAETFRDSDVFAAGGRLRNLDESLQESVAGPLTIWSVFLEQTYLDVIARKLGKGYWRTFQLPSDRKSNVDQVMGACLMVRNQPESRFDERFFLYCEDTELCKRLQRLGNIVYEPQAEFFHELGSSSSQNRWLSVARYNLGKELYFRIHHGPNEALIVFLLNRLGALLRILVSIPIAPFSSRARVKLGIFVKVLFARKSQIIPAEHIQQ